MRNITQPETLYTWNVTDKFGNVVARGAVTDFVEFDLEYLPFGFSVERNLDEVQDTMTKSSFSPEWKEQGLVFKYKAYILGLDLSLTERNDDVVMDKGTLVKKLEKLNLAIQLNGGDAELVDKVSNAIILVFEEPKTDDEMANALSNALDIQIEQEEANIPVEKGYVRYLKGIRKKLFE